MVAENDAAYQRLRRLKSDGDEVFKFPIFWPRVFFYTDFEVTTISQVPDDKKACYLWISCFASQLGVDENGRPRFPRLRHLPSQVRPFEMTTYNVAENEATSLPLVKKGPEEEG